MGSVEGGPRQGIPARREVDGWPGSPPPGTPAVVIWGAWLVGQVGVPVAVLAWFLVEASKRLREIAESQRVTVYLLEELVRRGAP